MPLCSRFSVAIFAGISIYDHQCPDLGQVDFEIISIGLIWISSHLDFEKIARMNNTITFTLTLLDLLYWTEIDWTFWLVVTSCYSKPYPLYYRVLLKNTFLLFFTPYSISLYSSFHVSLGIILVSIYLLFNFLNFTHFWCTSRYYLIHFILFNNNIISFINIYFLLKSYISPKLLSLRYFRSQHYSQALLSLLLFLLHGYTFTCVFSGFYLFFLV